MMVAVNDGTGLQYLLTDHLGSTVAVTNSSGTLTSQQRYLPFGAPRTIPNSPILGTDFTYTGQRKLDDGMGGVMDYRARFYSPYLNRFLQPDSIIPDQTNPQSWNRFSYVLNRPTLFNDPTGHVCEDPEKEGAVCFGSASVQTRVGDKMIRGNGAELGKAKNKPTDKDMCNYSCQQVLLAREREERGCGQGGIYNCPPEPPDDFMLEYLPETVTVHPLSNKVISQEPIYDDSYWPPKPIGYTMIYYKRSGDLQVNPYVLLSMAGDEALFELAKHLFVEYVKKPLAGFGISLGCSPECTALYIGYQVADNISDVNNAITFEANLVSKTVIYPPPPSGFNFPIDLYQKIR